MGAPTKRSQIIGKPGDDKIVRAFAVSRGITVKEAVHYLLQISLKQVYEHPEKYTFKEAENARKTDIPGGSGESISGG